MVSGLSHTLHISKSVLCHSEGCTVKEYAQICKNVDDRFFAVSYDNIEPLTIHSQSVMFQGFLEKAEQMGHPCNEESFEAVELKRVSLTGRGRANQAVIPRQDGEENGTCVLKVNNDGIHLMSVDRIFGVIGENGKVSWLAFFGPVWSCTQTLNGFEVFEFNARMHFEGKQWWSIDEVQLPCWVRHMHRYVFGAHVQAQHYDLKIS